jgi:uncharacterized protein (TIGR01777 family)
MKILFTGGTGLIGSELIKHLAHHQIVLLTRDIPNAEKKLLHMPPGTITYIDDLHNLAHLDDIDAVINLAGEPIADKRWSTKQKQIICDSRWQITEQLVELIERSTTPPHTFISGSAVGFYGDQGQFAVDEELRVDSQAFTHQICYLWEQIALKAQSSKTRVCLLRTGVVLSPCGGALKKMLPPYKLGLGGPIGHGDQFMPWIHILDMVNAILFILNNPKLTGAVNLCAPHPITNQTFSETLANSLHRPHLFSTPAWLIRLLMGESSALLLDSMRVKPSKLTRAGFEFQFPRLDQALKQLLETPC